MTPRLKLLAAGVAAFFAALFATRAGGDGSPYRRPGGAPGSSRRPVDPYAPHEPATAETLGAPQPGVLLFRKWALAKWGERAGSPQNILADKPGEHREGRAWDLMTTSLGHGQSIVDALTAPDPESGEPDALARRAGIMYMIWNRQMWRSYPWQGRPAGSWGPYTGASPHTDHVHFSFSREGAAGKTSLYDEIRRDFPVA